MIKIAAGKPWKMTKSVSSVNTNRYTIELDLITHKVKTIESSLFYSSLFLHHGLLKSLQVRPSNPALKLHH